MLFFETHLSDIADVFLERDSFGVEDVGGEWMIALVVNFGGCNGVELLRSDDVGAFGEERSVVDGGDGAVEFEFLRKDDVQHLLHGDG